MIKSGRANSLFASLPFTTTIVRLNRLPLAAYVGFALALYMGLMLAVMGRYEWNPSALPLFGHYYIEQNEHWTPEGAVRLLGNEQFGGNGYDGQIFYYYARTLFEPGVWPEGFNNAYRAPRLGYPLLGALLAPLLGGGSWGTLLGLIVAQLLLLALSVALLYLLLPPTLRYLTLFYIINPFALQSAILLVSDSIVAALLIIGYFFFRTPRHEAEAYAVDRDLPLGERIMLPPQTVIALPVAFLAFSLAVLTKESSLFLLFPLGLLALIRRDLLRASMMVTVLLPFLAWQIYLRTSHGMVPASVLQIFLSPLDGVFGLFVELGRSLSGGSLGELVRSLVKLLLLSLIPAALYASWPHRREAKAQGDESGDTVIFRLGVLFTVASLLIADYYYFWSVYENISRMFTVVVPILLLMLRSSPDLKHYATPFWVGMSLLFILVVVRTIFVTPIFPYDIFVPWSGIDFGGHAPLPRSH